MPSFGTGSLPTDAISPQGPRRVHQASGGVLRQARSRNRPFEGPKIAMPEISHFKIGNPEYPRPIFGTFCLLANLGYSPNRILKWDKSGMHAKTPKISREQPQKGRLRRRKTVIGSPTSHGDATKSESPSRLPAWRAGFARSLTLAISMQLKHVADIVHRTRVGRGLGAARWPGRQTREERRGN